MQFLLRTEKHMRGQKHKQAHDTFETKFVSLNYSKLKTFVSHKDTRSSFC